ncbi:transcription factor HES-4-A-like [Zerene cesonia]|uniref:transcription factor HES-4-A-like n=1 Tax=Zerene cesonia TaxID=33412 RepID=UPI0018E53C37|nr:transcription factor HES-4-A-like [Zerene cesonia]
MASDPAPLSKTAKYKKITKPLLERKRRARINRCLDELKDLMVGALEIDDDNLSKLEKADILELTVNHLTKLHRPKDPILEAKKFQAGFGQCAAEACRFIMSVPDLDTKVSQNLISHLSTLITAQPLSIQVPERPSFSPPTSPSSVVSDRQHYYSDHERSSSDAEDSVYSSEGPKNWPYARPNKPSPPMPGLLTTVDKLVPQHNTDYGAMNGHRNGAYFNRVPAEAKDVILQKIRQHIMDKRGNENANSADVNVNAELPTEKEYVHREETYSNDYSYYSPNYPNDTLDLRKVRSPLKSAEYSPKDTRYTKEPDTVVENKADIVSVPEPCELPMDYSNLPPKKKRKLIEYQEYKKQEEARRQQNAFYAEKNERSREGPPADHELDANKWRPW